MPDMLYRKVGRRYYEVRPDFVGWPAPGIWLVEESPNRKSSQVIAKLGEVPDPVEFAAFAKHTDAIAVAIVELRGQFLDGTPLSPMNCAEVIVRKVYAKGRGG